MKVFIIYFMHFFLLGLCVADVSFPVKKIELYAGASLKKEGEPVLRQGAALVGNEISCIASVKDKDELVYGFSYHIDGSYFLYDTKLLVGNLRFSRAVSRMKRPVLSSSSAISSLSLLSPGIAPSLPSFSSSKNDDSVAFVLTPGEKYPHLPGIEYGFTSGGDRYMSVYKKGSFDIMGINVSSVVSVSKGDFVYGGKGSSSWFYKEHYYRKKRYESCDFSAGIKAGSSFAWTGAFGWTENPWASFSDYYFWHRNQFSFRVKALTLKLGWFEANDGKMLLPTGSMLNVNRQFVFNPQIGVLLPAGVFRFGVSVQKDDKIKSGKDVEFDYYTLKFASSLQRGHLKLSGEYTRKDDNYAATAEHNFSFGASYSSSSFSTSSTLSLKIDDTKKVFSFRQSLSPSVGFLSYVYAGFSRTNSTRGEDYSSFSGGVTMKYSTSLFNFQGKVTYYARF